jgi:predicted Zn-dependent peptidase
MYMIRKELLPNGMQLLTETMPQVRSVCVGVWLRRGSRNERAAVNGISHFIEHLVFKGTQRRNAREIALAMDSLGGQMDAFTSKEYTCFYARVLDERLPQVIDLLADIVQRPLFDPVELERERRVVLEEIRMIDDTPDDLIYDLFSTMVYGGNPLGRPIQGTLDSVSGLSRRQLKSFFQLAYRPRNMLIVSAGNVRHARVSKLVQQAFRGIKKGRKENSEPRRPRLNFGLVKCPKRELEQLHVLMGVEAVPRTADERYQLHVLNTLLGGTMSSRLFQKIREERGLAYNVYSGVSSFKDTGTLNVYVGTNPKKGAEVCKVIMQELHDLSVKGPTQQELALAKEHLKGSSMLGLESTSSRMSHLARQECYFGKQVTLAQTLKGLERVTVERVHQLARRLFEGRPVALAAVGKVGQLGIKERDLWL